jgi:endonuclease/exonuclease/phosphatase family metal-dependent hydrolase
VNNNLNIRPLSNITLLLCLCFVGCVSKTNTDNVLKNGIALNPESKLRIVSYNTFYTSVFPKDNGDMRSTKHIKEMKMNVPERVRQFASWGKQAKADIFALQETIYVEEDQKDTSPKGIGRYFSKVTGQKWHSVGDGQGRLVLSRHPVLWSGRVKNARGMAALIDLPDSIHKDDLLLINLHFLSGKSKDRQAIRKRMAWNVKRFFIDQVRSGEFDHIPKDVPIVICGDLNSEETDVPHNILAKQDPEATEGDGKHIHFQNPFPRELTSKNKNTFGRVNWSSVVGSSSFTGPHATIDHIMVQKGFMTVHHSFIFNSLITPKEVLERYGVEREAVLVARDGLIEELDHLPIFVDLK